MATRKTRAKRAATQMLRELNLTNPPIDVAWIARQLGVDVRSENLGDDVSGLLVVSGGRPTIAINAFHPVTRQRFSLAHELGHFRLHYDNNEQEALFVDKRMVFARNPLSSEGISPIEIQANQFAAELLMPEKLLEEHVRANEGDIDLLDEFEIYRLARLFQVSEQAITIRLTNLDYQLAIE